MNVLSKKVVYYWLDLALISFRMPPQINALFGAWIVWNVTFLHTCRCCCAEDTGSVCAWLGSNNVCNTPLERYANYDAWFYRSLCRGNIPQWQAAPAIYCEGGSGEMIVIRALLMMGQVILVKIYPKFIFCFDFSFYAGYCGHRDVWVVRKG